jgi:alkanesulfonate monooxygenase SsuD/methylene tetrahydromethanopterin reductase-like flavin-dependent oxidoreductase (luciferase family)
MKAIWTSDVAEYHGEFVDFEPMWCWPKPVQKPYPPILLGGAFPYGARRAIEYGDGWMPVGGREQDPLEIGRRFRQLVAESGRDPATVPMSVYGPRHEKRALMELRDAGMDRAVLAIPTAPRDAALAKLDDMAALATGL